MFYPGDRLDQPMFQEIKRMDWAPQHRGSLQLRLAKQHNQDNRPSWTAALKAICTLKIAAKPGDRCILFQWTISIHFHGEYIVTCTD